MITAALAQSVERRSRKAKVSGSIPEGGSKTRVSVNLKTY